ncbi:unnamed protein product [Bursaphelenchus okinawaensis]|uniref:Uncharacterized protein n=1 Tax=Bursaphelenchus okinawaensis TaxID=465554 RepID=A0A811JRH0_9BILA|nr:unnamed protein product [Bursaphelenchus okinawaensis]CAG9080181.1 unnamed protein product [Bursaphelenchus okinawaensis]
MPSPPKLRSRKPSKSPAKPKPATPKTKSPPKKRAASKSPARSKAAKSPVKKTPAARGRGRPSKSRTSSPASVASLPSSKGSPPRKTKASPAKPAPRRSRSRSIQRNSRNRSSSSHSKPVKIEEIKVIKQTPLQQQPTPGSRSSLRLRQANGPTTLTKNLFSGLSPRSPARAAQPYWTRVKNSKVGRYVRGIPRRCTVANAKRAIQKHWRKALIAGLLVGVAYYSYYNKKQIQKHLQEQYEKLADLVAKQKRPSIFGGDWFVDTPPTAVPPKHETVTEIPRQP